MKTADVASRVDCPRGGLNKLGADEADDNGEDAADGLKLVDEDDEGDAADDRAECRGDVEGIGAAEAPKIPEWNAAPL